MTKQPTTKELLAMLAKVQAENEALKKAQPKPRALTIKISEKGCISVYGLGRFPVSLYRDQWERLLGFDKDIKEYINKHSEEITVIEQSRGE